MNWQSTKAWFRRFGKPGHKSKRKPGAKPELKHSERRILILAYTLCAILLAVDAYALYINASRAQHAAVPQELLGRWITNARGYSGRALEITDSTVVFHAGEAGSMSYAIDRVGADHQEQATFYSMHYGGWRDGLELNLRYVDVPHAQIRMQNQQHVTWVRQADN